MLVWNKASSSAMHVPWENSLKGKGRCAAEAEVENTADLQVIKVSWHVVKGSACVKQLAAGEVLARLHLVLKYYEGSLNSKAVHFVHTTYTFSLTVNTVSMTRL